MWKPLTVLLTNFMNVCQLGEQLRWTLRPIHAHALKPTHLHVLEAYFFP